MRAETGVKFTKEWNFVNSAPHCGGVFDICELLTAQMLGNTLVGQLTGEALCKSGYDCGICFSFELCGIEHESKDVLSINFCSCFNFAARGDQNLWVTTYCTFSLLEAELEVFYLFEQLSTQPRLRNREISTSKL